MFYVTKVTLSFLIIPDSFTFANMFVQHFSNGRGGSSFNLPPTRGETPAVYIRGRLTENTLVIKKIAELIIAPFMNEPEDKEPVTPRSGISDRTTKIENREKASSAKTRTRSA